MTRLLFVFLLLTNGAFASPDISPRPQARFVAAAAPAVMLRPALRPMSKQLQAEQDLLAIEGVVHKAALVYSARPSTRPKSLEQRVMAKKRARRKGAVCGDPDLQGDFVGTVPGRIRACGIKNAVRLRSVAGISLSQPATLDCPTAKALKKWVNKGLTPAVRSRGKVAQIKVAAHYACRTRNNQKGAKVSEHGKGRAIDISGITMQDGSTISVLNGWGRGADGRALKKMHKAACGPFGTVLGPNSDRFHKDHFHFDTARYRSGSYCR